MRQQEVPHGLTPIFFLLRAWGRGGGVSAPSRGQGSEGPGVPVRGGTVTEPTGVGGCHRQRGKLTGSPSSQTALVPRALPAPGKQTPRAWSRAKLGEVVPPARPRHLWALGLCLNIPCGSCGHGQQRGIGALLSPRRGEAQAQAPVTHRQKSSHGRCGFSVTELRLKRRQEHVLALYYTHTEKRVRRESEREKRGEREREIPPRRLQRLSASSSEFRGDAVPSPLFLSMSPPLLSIQLGVLRALLHKSLPRPHLGVLVPGTFWRASGGRRAPPPPCHGFPLRFCCTGRCKAAFRLWFITALKAWWTQQRLWSLRPARLSPRWWLFLLQSIRCKMQRPACCR